MATTSFGSVVYTDWSDDPDLEGKRDKYGELSMDIDEYGTLNIYLRRTTKTKREFMIQGLEGREVYKLLKEHFGDES